MEFTVYLMRTWCCEWYQRWQLKQHHQCHMLRGWEWECPLLHHILSVAAWTDMTPQPQVTQQQWQSWNVKTFIELYSGVRSTQWLTFACYQAFICVCCNTSFREFCTHFKHHASDCNLGILDSVVARNFFQGGGVRQESFSGEFNKFSWGQRAERTEIWGR
jgi:hypothetical protein